MQRFYILPVESVIIGGVTYGGPKYLKWRQNPTGIDTLWSQMRFGLMQTMVVFCPAITPADDATLSANPDVVAFPVGLDGPVTDSAFKASLESLSIPTDWATPSTTYLQLLRVLGGLFQFGQVYSRIAGVPLFDGTITLDSNYNQLGPTRKQAFEAALVELGWTGGITGNPKLRSLAKQAGDLWAGRPLIFGGFEF